MPISTELLRVLKPTGTFVLNIKEKVVDGERSIYVLELVLAMRKQGWLWTEEFIWPPGAATKTTVLHSQGNCRSGSSYCLPSKATPCLTLFAGSGTTIVVAEKMRRNSIGIEIVPDTTR